MNEFDVVLNPVVIISKETSTTAPAYVEAAKTIESDTPKAMGYLKSFITTIETVASNSNVNDSRLSSTRGNINKFVGYQNIKSAIDFLTDNLSGVSIVKNLIDIHKALLAYRTEYTLGYDKQVRLIMLEYESALYLLVTGLTYAMANNIEIVQTGTKIIVRKKSGSDKGVIVKTVDGLAKQLKTKDHQEYLKILLTAKDNKQIDESVMLEGAISDTADILQSLFHGGKKLWDFSKNAWQMVKRTMFGILPLIRSVIYLRYKKKADTILALDQQVAFIEENIKRLQNMQNMDADKKAKIIKAQQAYITAFQKKAEKLRAELIETERDASNELKEPSNDIKDDNEMVLEKNPKVKPEEKS